MTLRGAPQTHALVSMIWIQAEPAWHLPDVIPTFVTATPVTFATTSILPYQKIPLKTHLRQVTPQDVVIVLVVMRFCWG